MRFIVDESTGIAVVESLRPILRLPLSADAVPLADPSAALRTWIFSADGNITLVGNVSQFFDPTIQNCYTDCAPRMVRNYIKTSGQEVVQ